MNKSKLFLIVLAQVSSMLNAAVPNANQVNATNQVTAQFAALAIAPQECPGAPRKPRLSAALAQRLRAENQADMNRVFAPNGHLMPNGPIVGRVLFPENH